MMLLPRLSSRNLDGTLLVKLSKCFTLYKHYKMKLYSEINEIQLKEYHGNNINTNCRAKHVETLS